MNIDEKIKEIENHLHNLYEDADRTYTRHEDADMVIEVTAKQLKEYEDLLTELKKYKDMEAAGKLLKLSCKVGDIVYVSSSVIPIENTEYSENYTEVPPYLTGQIVSFRFGERNWMKIAIKTKWLKEWLDDETGPESGYIESTKYFTVLLSSVGKTVFLSKEEAKMKLEATTISHKNIKTKVKDGWEMA